MQNGNYTDLIVCTVYLLRVANLFFNFYTDTCMSFSVLCQIVTGLGNIAFRQDKGNICKA